MTTPVEIDWAKTLLYWPGQYKGAKIEMADGTFESVLTPIAPWDREKSPTFETTIYVGDDDDGYWIGLSSRAEVDALIADLIAARDEAFGETQN